MPPTKKYQDRPEQMQAWSDFNGYTPEELEEHDRGYSGVIRGFHPFVCPGDGDINSTYVVKAGMRFKPQDYTDFDQAGGSSLSVPPAP